MNLDKTKKAFREILSEPGANGTLSWGRVASSISLVAAIIWVSHVLIHTHAIPDVGGLTGFVLAPYGSNKLATAAQSFSNKS